MVASVKIIFQERNLHPKTSFAFRWYNPNLWWNSISWILPADLPWIFLPLWRFSLYFDYLKNPIRNIWEGEAISGTCFNFLISKNRFSFLLITWSEKCIAQTKTCLNSWTSLRFRNLSKGFLRCSSSGNWKNALSRVRHCLWTIRERCICWLFSCHIPFSINNYLFPFHLEKNLNFQRYNFLIGILDVCRIPRIYLNAEINVITSLRLLFYSESMRESSPYLKYSMIV